MKKILLATWLAAITLNAQTIQEDIASLIENIKSTKGDEKRLLINELKLKLRDQNIQTRQIAMKALRASQQSTSATTSTELIPKREQVMEQKQQQQSHGENAARFQLHKSENTPEHKGPGGKQ